ncbi:MAG: N-acetylmuramoyl-L-alanine amidase [Elusimicrobia bacterium]|nr:N-acetylmuramoyl-L-alanine amidase [Candidatus Obscuribacterium magneticum]
MTILLFRPPALFGQSPLFGHCIVIDAGHGTMNFDGIKINEGRVVKGLPPEHKLTLEIAARLKDLLEKEGAKVFMTRTPSNYWRQAYNAVEDNKERAIFSNLVGAEAFLSLHCDWDTRRWVRGVATYYNKKNSRRLGAILQRSLVKTLNAHDRQAGFDSFTVLESAEGPGVLIETGFLSHRSESKRLADPAYQKKMAAALTEGLKRYFAATQVASTHH